MNTPSKTLRSENPRNFVLSLLTSDPLLAARAQDHKAISESLEVHRSKLYRVKLRRDILEVARQENMSLERQENRLGNKISSALRWRLPGQG